MVCKVMRKPLVLTIVFVFACGITLSSIMAFAQEDYNIPAWIKNNAAWWSEGQIDDASFVSGIKYLIENGIMEISQGDTQAANDDLYQENQELASLLAEYQEANDMFAENEEVLYTEIDSLKSQLQVAQSANTAGSSSVQNLPDNGDFYLVYIPTYDYVGYEEWLQTTGYDFEGQIAWLNTVFRLPYDVPIIIADSSYDPNCDPPNAFYFQGQITMCYEYMAKTDLKFLQYYGEDVSQDVLDSSTINVIDHVFYHELGHALMDIYELPYTGPQEDAADQFSVYILTEYSEGYIGQDALYDAAINYGISHYSNDELVADYYADTHSLSIQRLFNLFCYAYGSDPVYNNDLIPLIPPNRLQWCSIEYDDAVYAWNTLLEPYFK